MPHLEWTVNNNRNMFVVLENGPEGPRPVGVYEDYQDAENKVAENPSEYTLYIARFFPAHVR